jgi:hypothetical protein
LFSFKRNANKKKAKGLKQDMNKIFRACGGKSFEDVETLILERRELQVQIKIYKAEKEGAIDDLKAYKDALTKSMVEQTREKPKTLRETVREKAKSGLAKVRRGSSSGNSSSGGGGNEPPRLTVVELQNLTFTLMDKIEEKDARIKMKEYEKRAMFDRIIKLEEIVQSFERRDEEDEEEEE